MVRALELARLDSNRAYINALARFLPSSARLESKLAQLNLNSRPPARRARSSYSSQNKIVGNATTGQKRTSVELSPCRKCDNWTKTDSVELSPSNFLNMFLLGSKFLFHYFPKFWVLCSVHIPLVLIHEGFFSSKSLDLYIYLYIYIITI